MNNSVFHLGFPKKSIFAPPILDVQRNAINPYVSILTPGLFLAQLAQEYKTIRDRDEQQVLSSHCEPFEYQGPLEALDLSQMRVANKEIPHVETLPPPPSAPSFTYRDYGFYYRFYDYYEDPETESLREILTRLFHRIYELILESVVSFLIFLAGPYVSIYRSIQYVALKFHREYEVTLNVRVLLATFLLASLLSPIRERAADESSQAVPSPSRNSLPSFPDWSYSSISCQGEGWYFDDEIGIFRPMPQPMFNAICGALTRPTLNSQPPIGLAYVEIEYDIDDETMDMTTSLTTETDQFLLEFLGCSPTSPSFDAFCVELIQRLREENEQHRAQRAQTEARLNHTYDGSQDGKHSGNPKTESAE